MTYVNFPTTEFLDLPFLDFFCFNVYLEQRERLEAYIARLQNLAGERPLVLAELGLDSRRAAKQRQATTLAWQIEAGFTAALPARSFSRGPTSGIAVRLAVDDWDFGLVRRDRSAEAGTRRGDRRVSTRALRRSTPPGRASPSSSAPTTGIERSADTFEALGGSTIPT